MGCCSSSPKGPDEEIQSFKVEYLNTVRVTEPSKAGSLGAAVDRILALKAKPDKALFELTPQAAVVRNAKSYEMVVNVRLKYVVQILMAGPKRDVIAILSSDPGGKIFTCAAVRAGKKTAAIQQQLGAAIAAAKQPQENTSSAATVFMDVDSAGKQDAQGAKNPSPRKKSTFSDHAPQIADKEFKAVYLGKVVVTEKHGPAIIQAAVKNIKAEGKQPYEVDAKITFEEMRLVERGTDYLVQACTMTEVSFSCIDKGDKKILGYITVDKHDIRLCHAIKLTSQSQSLDVYKSVTAAFDAAMVMKNKQQEMDKINMSDDAREYAGRLSVVPPKSPSLSGLVAMAAPEKEAELEVDASRPLGTFVGRYLGSIRVEKNKGQDVMEAALAEFAEKTCVEKKERWKNLDVVMVVSGEGIRVIEQNTSEVRFLTRLGTVLFCTSVHAQKVLKKLKPYTPRWEESVFAYIEKNDKLRTKRCYFFSIGRQAVEVCNKINDAFQVAVLINKLRKGNPFAAFSSSREDTPLSLYHLQVHREDLKSKKVIGMGQFGEVYLASQTVVAGTGDDGGDTIGRAVKMLKGSASVADRGEFLHEAEMMLKLAHPALVTLVGVAVQQRPWLVVIEMMKYGDLYTFTMAAKDKSFRIRYLEHLHITRQVAEGMVFIESQNMIHMDLAARNILLHENVLAKIADFGLTRMIPEGKKYYRLMHTLKLPVKWMALESIVDKIFSPKTDVWAFGITVWEIMAYGAIPYGDMKNIEVEQNMKDGVRLECAEKCPQEFHNLLLTCWLKDPDDRPNFAQLSASTNALLDKAKTREPPMRNIGKLMTEWDAGKAAAAEEEYSAFVSSRAPPPTAQPPQSSAPSPVTPAPAPEAAGAGNAEEVDLDDVAPEDTSGSAKQKQDGNKGKDSDSESESESESEANDSDGNAEHRGRGRLQTEGGELETKPLPAPSQTGPTMRAQPVAEESESDSDSDDSDNEDIAL